MKGNVLYSQYHGRRWFYGFLIVASLFLFTLLNIELTMRFEYFNVLLFLLGIGCLAVGLTSAFSPYRILRDLRFQFFALSGALVGSTILGGLTMSWQESRSIRLAHPILQALESYHSEMDRFPGSLSDLVPKYLPQIPKTGMGIFPRDYYYIHIPKERKFYLYFDIEGSEWVYRYNSYYNSWDAADASLTKKATPI